MCAVRVTTGQGRSTIPARVLWSTNRRTAQCRSAVHVREVRLLVLHVVRQRIRFVYRVVWASTSLGGCARRAAGRVGAGSTCPGAAGGRSTMGALCVTTGPGHSTTRDRLLRSVRRTVRCRRAADVREVRSLILHVVRQRIRFVYRVVAASMSLVGRAIRAQQHVREISMLALHVLQQAIGCACSGRARHVREISMLALNVLRQAIGYARRARHVREVSMLACSGDQYASTELNVLRQAIGGAQRVAAGPTSLVGRAIRVRHVRRISMLALNVLRQVIGCARRARHVREISMLALNVLRQAIGCARLNVLRQAIGGAQHVAAGPTSLVGRAIRARHVRRISMLALNVLRQAIGCAQRARHVREVSMLALNVLRQAIGCALRVAAGPTSLVGRAIRAQSVVLAKLSWCRALLQMIRYVGAAAGEAAAATRAPDGIW